MIKVLTLFLWIALLITITESYAENLAYEFKSVIELDSDNCPEGSHCLLQSYLAVALFSDKKIANRQVGVLLEDYFYCHDLTGNVYRAPVGLETDFLSIPELAQHVIRPKDFMAAGIVHDWLYAVGEPGKKTLADDIFHYMLKEQGAGFIKRNVMYKVVRWFGKSSYETRGEIPILDLTTMERISPSPVKRPITTIIANIDCSNVSQFEKIRRTHRSKYHFVVKTNQLFEHEGFVKEQY